MEPWWLRHLCSGQKYFNGVERVENLLINCGVELSLTFLFLQWKKRGLEGEEDSLEEISRGRKGENLGQILVLAAQLQALQKKFITF